MWLIQISSPLETGSAFLLADPFRKLSLGFIISWQLLTSSQFLNAKWNAFIITVAWVSLRAPYTNSELILKGIHTEHNFPFTLGTWLTLQELVRLIAGDKTTEACLFEFLFGISYFVPYDSRLDYQHDHKKNWLSVFASVLWYEDNLRCDLRNLLS